MGISLNAIPVLQDNYVWMLIDAQKRCVIIDPGEAEPVMSKIAANEWDPQAIFLTHHHADHVAGVDQLIRRWPNLRVYGPQETQEKGVTQVVDENSLITEIDLTFQVIATPGHTLGHISYFAEPYLFCGDTLFSGGCGRLFEGSPQQMYESLNKLMRLPQNSLICAAHEYTASNLKFARHIWPQNPHILSYQQKIKKLRENHQITLPTTLEKQQVINPFLNTQHIDLIKNVMGNRSFDETWQVFARLRQLKDNF